MTDWVADALAMFHFLRPAWLVALAGLPVLALLWRLRSRHDSPWNDVVDASLQPHVLEAGSGRVPRLPWRWLLVFALGVLALAGPAWRSLPAVAFQSSDALVVVVDLSPDSRAADVEPDRVTRMRLKLVRLVERRDGGLLGLAVFAGSAHTVSPLTADSATLRQLLDSLDPALMPVDGHRLADAIRHARGLLQNAGHDGGRILLLTDRADAAARAAAAEVHGQGFTVHVLGVGHVDGAPVRDRAGGFERGVGGEVRVARLDPATLRELARAGGGRFEVIQPGDGDLEALGVLSVDGPGMQGDGIAITRFRDEGPWLLLPMLALMLPGFRRGALAVALLGVVWYPPPLLAAGTDTLWQRPDQRAYRALEGRDYERARDLAEDPMIRGAAAFRLGEHEAAAAAFGEAGGADGLYNAGNALAAQARYEEAMSAWHEALALDPSHVDAQANIDALQAWLDQQPEPPDPQSGGREPDEDGADGGGERDAPPDSAAAGEGGADGEPDPGAEETDDESASSEGREGTDGVESADDSDLRDPGRDGAAEQALREAMDAALAAREEGDDEELAAELDAEALEAAERDEAIERWLRLVEDDPGALLRRKFMIEHQRRLQGERP